MGNPNKVVDDAEGFMSDDEDFDFATKSPPTKDPMAGIGYWESPGNSPKLNRKCPNICRSVQNAIAVFKEDIVLKRHMFPTEVLIDAVKKELPATDKDVIKSEIEIQVLDLLVHDVNIGSKPPPPPPPSMKADNLSIKPLTYFMTMSKVTLNNTSTASLRCSKSLFLL